MEPQDYEMFDRRLHNLEESLVMIHDQLQKVVEHLDQISRALVTFVDGEVPSP